MRSTIKKEAFVGFTFNEIHSSQFGLYSVTNGGRYKRGLSPSFSDSTEEITGGRGI
jgi:hypothetical protein